MVAIFTGLGLGTERGSNFLLGSRGQLGSASFGRYGENVSVNAANGNLSIQRNDEVLTGVGSDLTLGRNYNSQGPATDDNGDNWRLSGSRTVTLTSGTVNTVGSTVTRVDWDGSDTLYTWDATRNAYINTQQGDAYDKIVTGLTSGTWTWTDGTTGATEAYASGRITSSKDANGNTITYTYTGSLLTKVAMADGEYVSLSYSGNNLTQVATYAKATSSSSVALLLTRVHYTYDTQNRLSTVTTDLTPTDNSVTDGNSVTTTYTYDGTSKRVASISQTGGARLDISYVLVGSTYRVASFTQAQAAGASSTTIFSYDVANNVTSVIDNNGQESRLTYDAQGHLTRLEQMPTALGWTPQLDQWVQNADGSFTRQNGGLAGSVLSTASYSNADISATITSATNAVAVGLYDPVSGKAWDIYAYGSDSAGSDHVLLGNLYVPFGSGPGGTTDISYNDGSASFAPGDKLSLRWVNGVLHGFQNDTDLGAVPNGPPAGTPLRVFLAGFQDGATLQNVTLTQTVLPGVSPQVSTFTYDTNGRVTGATDPLGNLTTYTYDTNGNLTLKRDALGNATAWTYDSANHCLTETQYLAPDPDGSGPGTYSQPVTTRYAYDAKGNLAYIVTAEGRVTQNLYYSNGTLSQTLLMAPKTYNVSALGPSTSIAFATLNSWVSSYGDKSACHETNYLYDFRGNLSSTLVYPATFASGGGEGDYSMTSYAYDQAGNLLTVSNMMETVSVTQFDGLGRIISRVDATGEHDIVYDDAHNVQTETVGGGATTVNVFDLAGELISTTASGSGADVTADQSTYAYDSLGRLRMQTDAIGNEQYFLYDADGRKIADISADGAMTEYVYDSDDRPIRTISYANRLSSAQIASLADGQGKPALIDISAVRPTTSSSDRDSWTIYDAAGRVIEAIDSTGHATVYSYDGASEVVGTTHYYTALNVAALQASPPTVLTLPAANALDATTRGFYDKDGNLVGSLDAAGTLTESSYDSAGQLIRTIVHAKPASTSLRAAGTMAQLLADVGTTGADRQTNFVYDGSGALRFKIDAQGNVTEFDYDKEGNLFASSVFATPIAPAASYTMASVQGTVDYTNARASYAIYQDGKLAITVDPSGQVTTFTYQNDVLVETHAYATLYDVADNGVWAGDFLTDPFPIAASADDRITRVYTDSANRPVYTVDAEGYVTQTHYDADWRVTSETRYPDPVSVDDTTTTADVASMLNPAAAGTAVVQYSYDADGRVDTLTDPDGGVVKYGYDAFGEVSDTTTAYGTSAAVTTHRTYDQAGRLATITTAAGTAAAATTSYTYDAAGNVLTVTDALNATTTNSYDNLGRLISVTDAQNATTTYQYDAFGDRVKTTDALGNATYSYFDTLGRLTLAVDPDGYATSTTYNNFNEIASVTRYMTKIAAGYDVGTPPAVTASAADRTTSFTRDILGRITAMTDASQATETYEFDSFGDQVERVDKLGKITTRTYDHRGLLLSETHATAQDANGNVTQGVTTNYAYDNAGRLRTTTDALSHRSYRLYDGAGREIADIAADGAVTEYVYDAAGHVTRSIRYATRLSTAQLASLVDAQGKPADIDFATLRPAADAADSWNWSVYDAAGRLAETIDGVGAATSYVYDGDGQLIASTRYKNLLTVASLKASPPTALQIPASDAKDETTRTFYDQDDRVIGILAPDGALTETVYDASGQKIRVSTHTNLAAAALRASGSFADILANVQTTWKDARTDYVYDADGQLVFTLDATARPTGYVYDAAGNVVQTTEYAGAIATAASYSLAYVQAQLSATGLATDGDNRVSHVVYDNAGRIAFAIDAGGTVSSFVYDAAGHVTKQVTFAATDPGTGDYSLATWQAWGAAHASAGADHVSYQYYDALGREVYSARVAAGQAVVVETQYDALGQVTATIQHSKTYAIDDSTTIAALAGEIAGAPEDASATYYSYDAAGHLTDVLNPANSDTHYAYDALNRVTDTTYAFASSDAATTHITYDADGQVLSQTEAVGWTDANHRAATTSYSYDAFGNVLTVTDALNNVTTNTYYAMGRLHSVTDPNNATITYEYDAFGHRVTSTDQRGNTTLSYYDALGRLTLQVDPEGYATATSYSIGGAITSITRYMNRVSGNYGPSTLPTITPAANDEITSFTLDHLDRVTAVTDAEEYSELYTLDAFGNRTQVTNKLGGVTNNTFNALGQLQSSTKLETATDVNGTVYATSITTQYEYDTRGNRTLMREAAGLPEQRVTNYRYDKLNRLVWQQGEAFGVVNADGTTTTPTHPVQTYSYDLRGNLIEQDAPGGARTLFYYDAANHMIAQVGPTGSLTTWARDANGNATVMSAYGTVVALPALAGGTPPAAINPSLRRDTHYSYDKNNRLQSTTHFGVDSFDEVAGEYQRTIDDISTSATYDAAGNIVVETDGRNNPLYNYYDKNGHKIATVDQDNYLTTYDLDGEGNVLTETRYATQLTMVVSEISNVADLKAAAGTSSNDRITQFTYDRDGRRLTESRLNMLASTVTGSGAPSQTTVTSTIQYTYNALGEVTRKTEANGDYTGYSYDQMGRQTEIRKSGWTDPTSGAAIHPTTDMQYDGLDQLSRQLVRGTDDTTEADDRITTYLYDTAGHVTQTKDPTGFITKSYYDAAGRLAEQSYQRQKSDGSVVTEADFYSYDLAGRQIQQKKGAFDGTSWTYGQTTDMLYDAYGEMVARGINANPSDPTTYQEFADYDVLGRVWRTNFGDGAAKAYLYDANGNATLLMQATNNQNIRSMSTDDMFQQTSGVTQTISKFDNRNQLIETIQPSIENADDLPNAINTLDTSTTGTSFSGGTMQIVAPAGSSNPGGSGNQSGQFVSGPSGTAASQVINEGNGSYYVATTVSTGSTGPYGNGMIYLGNDSGTTMYLSVGTPPLNNRTVGETEAFTGWERNYYIWQDFAGTKVMIGRINHVSTSNTYVATSISPTILFSGLNAQATQLVAWAKKTGTNVWSRISTYPVTGVNGGVVGGYFTADLSNFTAGQTYDIKYYGMSATGTTLESHTASLSMSSTGQPTASGDVKQGIGGTGKVILTNDGGASLVFSEQPGNSVALQYRDLATTNALANFGTATGSNGLLTIGVNSLTSGHTYQFVATSGGQVTSFTFTPGSQPSAPSLYSSPFVTLTQPAAATSVVMTWTGANTGSANLVYNGTKWVWDVSPFFNVAGTTNFSYKTYDSGTVLIDQGHGQIQLAGNPQVLQNVGDALDSVVTFNPPATATKLVLNYRQAGNPSLKFTKVTLNGPPFLWDVQSLVPGAGTKKLEFYYDAYNSSGTLLPAAGGNPHTSGYLILNSNRTTTVQQSEWVITLPADPEAIIDRTQAYDAFGDIISETDGNNHTINMSYDVMGKLTQKQSPLTTVVDEHGNPTQQRPTENYFYDIAGRLVGVQDANHNYNMQTLLAGTGEDGSDAITTEEFHADGGTVKYGIDIFGDALTVENEDHAITANSYDADGRLTQVIHPTRTGGYTPGVYLTDVYAYDGLGQRIGHTQKFGTVTQSETTDYDMLGRVVRTMDLQGLVTTYGYSWNNGLTNAGTRTSGGWTKTTTDPSGHTLQETDDYYGRIVAKTDMGGHTFGYTYNAAGDLIHQTSSAGENTLYTYFGNGYVQSITDTGVGMVSQFEYDKEGNRTLETYQSVAVGGIQSEYQIAHIQYDELNRIKTFTDPRAVINYTYDADSNRREIKSQYTDGLGNTNQLQDFWYTYDNMNRFIISMGTFSGGTISIGTTGVQVAYDQANQRMSALNGSDGTFEQYSYTADGYLEDTKINGVLRSSRVNDALGRVTSYTEYTSGGAVSFAQGTTYDADNRVTDQSQQGGGVTTVIHNDYKADNGSGVYNGADQGVLIHTSQTGSSSQDTVYTYGWWDQAKELTIKVRSGSSGAYGFATGASNLSYDVNGHLSSATLTGGSAGTITYVNDAYGQVVYREQRNASSVIGVIQYYYYFDGNRIGDVSNNGPSNVDYNKALQQRGEGPVPLGSFRYGAPVASADFDENYQPIGPNYPAQAASQYTVRTGDTLQTIAQEVWGDSSMWYLIADANGLDAGDELDAGQIIIIPNKVTNIHNRVGVYRVYNPGEAIGDAMPTLPPQPVPPTHNHSGGCGAFGDILLVAVAVAVTAILTSTVVGAPAAFAEDGTLLSNATGLVATLGGSTAAAGSAAAIAGAATAAVGGSVVSQAFGVATGIQDHFSFTGVALAAISGGVAGGLAGVPELNGLKGVAGFAQGFARGAIANGLSQGISLATGLQSQFDWSGVAVGGVVSAVGGAIPGVAGKGIDHYLAEGLSGSAAAIAGAATRSLLTGSDFGDNVLRALPDAIGQTIGDAVAGKIESIAERAHYANMSVAESAAEERNRVYTLIQQKYGTDAADQAIQGLESQILANAQGRRAAIDQGTSLSDPAALRALQFGVDADPSPPTADGQEVVVSSTVSFGDKAAQAGLDVQQWIVAHPNLAEAVTYGGSLLRGGPVGLVTDYAVNKVVSAGLSATGLDKDIAKAADTLGAGVLSFLHSGEIGGDAFDNERSLAQSQAAQGNTSARMIIGFAGDVLGVTALAGLAAKLSTGRIAAADSAVHSALEAGAAHETERLAQLGIPKNNVVWRPGQADFDSAAFKVIVGDPKFTPGGLAKGTIFDGTLGGNLELKGGSSMLDSSYQLRLQTYRSLTTDTPLTIETTRPINPAFQSWLDRWGVSVVRPK